MFDQPMPRNSRLPESPRINSLLAGLMGSPTAPKPEVLTEPEPPARSTTARPFSAFLKSIEWAYVPSSAARIVITPTMPVREFFGLINWNGEKEPSAMSLGGSAMPPSVENLMSQFSWD